MSADVIHSSAPRWLDTALEHYRDGRGFRFDDDGGVGLQPRDFATGLKLVAAASKKGGVSRKKIAAILAGLGMSAVGVWMLRAALRDPEPVTRTALLISGGTTLVLGGGGAVLSALGAEFKASNGPTGIEVRPTR